MFEVAFADFYSFMLAFQRACFTAVACFGLSFWFGLVLSDAATHILGDLMRVSCIILASKTIKARASSYLILYMEQQAPSLHGHGLAYQQAGYWIWRIYFGIGLGFMGWILVMADEDTG